MTENQSYLGYLMFYANLVVAFTWYSKKNRSSDAISWLTGYQNSKPKKQTKNWLTDYSQ